MSIRRVTAAVGSAVFFLVAPGTVVGLIPWLLTGWQLRQLVPPYFAPIRVLGAILLVAGLIVLVQAFVRFVVEGLGTPAPIAAPERLVVGGLYRYVRNPMYVAVLAAIIGQALLLGQLGLLLYAAALWLISAAFVHWYEEGTSSDASGRGSGRVTDPELRVTGFDPPSSCPPASVRPTPVAARPANAALPLSMRKFRRPTTTPRAECASLDLTP